MRLVSHLLVPAVAVAVTGLCACGQSTDLPDDLAWQSPHFEYRARAGETVACGSTVDLLEQHFATVQSDLGFHWPTGQRIPYYKFIDVADGLGDGICARGACAVGASVRSYKAFHEHELVHAYLAPTGTPPSVLQEGIAVVMACDEVNDEMPRLSWDEAVLSNDPLLEESIYDTGGRWVHHLLHRYGPAPFLQLYAALPHTSTPAEVDAAITRIYGVSAAETWAEALAAPPACMPVWACSRPAMSTDGVAITSGEQCGYEQDSRTFTLPAEGNVLVATSAGVPFRVGACDDGQPRIRSLQPNIGFTYSPQRGLTELAAGQYFLEFPNSPSTLAVTVPADPWAGPDCAKLAPLEIAADDFAALRIVPPGARADWKISLHVDGPHLMRVAADAGVTASVCAGCDFTAAECQPTSTVNVLWNGDYRLSIDRPGAAGVTSNGIDILGR